LRITAARSGSATLCSITCFELRARGADEHVAGDRLRAIERRAARHDLVDELSRRAWSRDALGGDTSHMASFIGICRARRCSAPPRSEPRGFRQPEFGMIRRDRESQAATISTPPPGWAVHAAITGFHSRTAW
jgi:hypothetical protein